MTRSVLLMFLLLSSAAYATDVAYTASGAVAAAAGGNVTPALPSFQQDDILVVHCVSKDNIAHSMPSGWSQKAQASVSASTQMSVFWRRAQQGDAAAAVTHPAGSEIVCRCHGFRNVIGAGTGNGAGATGPWNAASASFISSSSSPISTPGVSPTSDGEALYFVGAGIGTNSSNAFAFQSGPASVGITSNGGASTARATSALFRDLLNPGDTDPESVSFSVSSAGSAGYASWLGVLGANPFAKVLTIPFNTYPSGTNLVGPSALATNISEILVVIDISQMTNPAVGYSLCFDLSLDGGVTWFTDSNPGQCYAGATVNGGVFVDKQGNPVTVADLDFMVGSAGSATRQLRVTTTVVGPITIGGAIEVVR